MQSIKKAVIYQYQSIHFIVAGIAGLHVIEKYDGKIPRITGLDPAGPGFPMEKARKRLDKSDAEFVDIYYTNRYTAGDIEHQVGHVDVYINGGKKQPGCAFPNMMQSSKYIEEMVCVSLAFSFHLKVLLLA